MYSQYNNTTRAPLWYDVRMISLPISRQRLSFLFRYAISGGVGALIQLFADMVAVEILGLHYQWGVIAGFLVALAVVFTMQKYWTFRDRSNGTAPVQFVVYTAIALGSLVANAGLMYLFVEHLSVQYLLAHALTIFIVMLSSFLLNNFVTFKNSPERILG